MVQWYDFQAKNQSQSDMEEISGLLLFDKLFGFRELVGPDVHDLQNLSKGFFMKAFCHGRSQIYQVPGNDRDIL